LRFIAASAADVWCVLTSMRRVPGGETSGVSFNSSGVPYAISFDR